MSVVGAVVLYRRFALERVSDGLGDHLLCFFSEEEEGAWYHTLTPCEPFRKALSWLGLATSAGATQLGILLPSLEVACSICL